jgi:hypothetical protein
VKRIQTVSTVCVCVCSAVPFTKLSIHPPSSHCQQLANYLVTTKQLPLLHNIRTQEMRIFIAITDKMYSPAKLHSFITSSWLILMALVHDNGMVNTESDVVVHLQQLVRSEVLSTARVPVFWDVMLCHWALPSILCNYTVSHLRRLVSSTAASYVLQWSASSLCSRFTLASFIQTDFCKKLTSLHSETTLTKSSWPK